MASSVVQITIVVWREKIRLECNDRANVEDNQDKDEYLQSTLRLSDGIVCSIFATMLIL